MYNQSLQRDKVRRNQSLVKKYNWEFVVKHSTVTALLFSFLAVIFYLTKHVNISLSFVFLTFLSLIIRIYILEEHREFSYRKNKK
ncbi:hypothetical protein [Apilactobacillus timberlakei]|uniref:hypothetical protein n=1 Tax=Apilactobacillus timberlakei TaxID=2008380 RepID=UPI001128EA87|nr:hypothetical protein [Apilactobacillus timberlakei]TPR16762.1 hypothetical protein DYZ95_07210 [Apilactobacillus timberlakei]TPR21525.1 hypothetical protein DY083_05760 [Apilactobacillus timberlakei]